LTLGGPFGDAALRDIAAAGFLQYCAEHALVPCFYSSTDGLWPMLQARAFSRVAVAQETRLAVRELEFKGKEWQNVRTALNRARKIGVTAVWGRYSEFPAALRAQLLEVSEEWAAQKSVPEMGFTLGGIDELMDDDVLCCVAVDPEGIVHGVTSWLPVFAEGRVVSWTLDFMRRREDGFPGVMEFLIASAVLELRTSVEVISLSGSPLAKDPLEASASVSPTDPEPDPGGLAAILDVVGKALEPVYGFRSLATFKSRFKPEYRTLYLYYQEPLQLPAIGRALSRAYLPGLSVRQSARLLRTLVR
jgi:phosphatidylglycerol lysyltransferase